MSIPRPAARRVGDSAPTHQAEDRPMATYTQNRARAARTAAATPAGPSRAANRALWTAQILLFAFLLFASALPKLIGEANAIETFDEIGWGQWFRYFTGVVEAAGAIGLVIPRLAGAAATGLIGVMIGAALTQILVIEPAWALLPVAF